MNNEKATQNKSLRTWISLLQITVDKAQKYKNQYNSFFGKPFSKLEEFPKRVYYGVYLPKQNIELFKNMKGNIIIPGLIIAKPYGSSKEALKDFPPHDYRERVIFRFDLGKGTKIHPCMQLKHELYGK